MGMVAPSSLKGQLWRRWKVGAQGNEGAGRDVSHGGEARTAQVLWDWPTLEFEVFRYHGFPCVGCMQAGRDIISVTEGTRKGQLCP